MAAHSSPIDAEFYLAADPFFTGQGATALTYDDVTLATLFSDVLPRDTNLETSLHERIRLPLPIVSADMDTVTEARMAIAMARNGGLGLIHANLPERQQLSEVSRVKNHVHGLIQEPIKVTAGSIDRGCSRVHRSEGLCLPYIPVVDASEKLIGLLPGHVVRPRYAAIRIIDAMTPRAQVQTVLESELGDDPIARADRFFNEHVGIHKLLVVDKDDRLRGLFTISDIERILAERSAHSLKPARDDKFRLLCGAALSATRTATGDLDRDRIVGHVTLLVERGVDAVAVSTAHGFSRGVGDAVALIRREFADLPIIAGNVTSAAGVEYLANAGANIIKVGQGPGSICTTRVVAGVGVPQLTALYVSARAAAQKGRSHPC
jgi:IMP dehydrogenase